MESKPKQINKDALHYIKKCWLPLTLTFLILVNLTIIPNLLNDPTIKLNDMSYLIPSNINTPEANATTSVPIITTPPVFNEGDIKSVNPQPDSPIIEEPKPIDTKPITTTNAGDTQHKQSTNFRFRLFLLVVFISVLIFMVILTKDQNTMEYSMSKSEKIYPDYKNLPQNSNDTEENI